MNEQPQNVLKLSPEKLMAGFTRTRFGMWIGAALVVHVLVIGSLSLGYIRDKWIDPVGAEQRKAAAEALLKANTPAPRPAPAPAAPATGTPPAPTERTLIEQRSNTPMMKAITQLPEANEIPKQPNDLGISLDDTRVK